MRYQICSKNKSFIDFVHLISKSRSECGLGESPVDILTVLYISGARVPPYYFFIKRSQPSESDGVHRMLIDKSLYLHGVDYNNLLHKEVTRGILFSSSEFNMTKFEYDGKEIVDYNRRLRYLNDRLDLPNSDFSIEKNKLLFAYESFYQNQESAQCFKGEGLLSSNELPFNMDDIDLFPDSLNEYTDKDYVNLCMAEAAFKIFSKKSLIKDLIDKNISAETVCAMAILSAIRMPETSVAKTRRTELVEKTALLAFRGELQRRGELRCELSMESPQFEDYKSIVDRARTSALMEFELSINTNIKTKRKSAL